VRFSAAGAVRLGAREAAIVTAEMKAGPDSRLGLVDASQMPASGGCLTGGVRWLRVKVGDLPGLALSSFDIIPIIRHAE